MAGTAVLGRLSWLAATVVELVDETPHVRSLVLDVEGWRGHRPGQHVDVRLTAEDGYQAERSYSIGSAPEEGRLVLTVERLDDGEVSPYLAGDLELGEQFELRGPVGGYFVWEVSHGGPLLLVGGGAGIVPLMSMAVTALQPAPMCRRRCSLVAGDRRRDLPRRAGAAGRRRA